jgi:hypothetical protein
MGSLVAELAEKLSSATNNLDFDEQTMFLNTSADTVGIGTNAPASKLDVRGTVQVGVNGTGHDVVFYGDTTGINMTWDQSEDALLIGGQTADAIAGVTAGLQIEGTTSNSSSVSIFRNSNDSASSFLVLGKSRGTAVGADTIIQDDDEVGAVRFAVADGVDRVSVVAEIRSMIGGTPGANDTPGELLFMTAADGAQTCTERMRIMADGKVGIGTTAPAATLHVKSSDGNMYFDSSSVGQANNLLFRDSAGTAHGQIEFTTTNSSVFTRNTSSLKLGSNNTAAITILNGGKVGIGTTAPAVALEVIDTGNLETVAGFGADDDGTCFISVRTAETQNNLAGITFSAGTATPTGVGSSQSIGHVLGKVMNSGGALQGELQFHTNDGDSITQKMVITEAGRVGIGSTAPGFGVDMLFSNGMAVSRGLNVVNQYATGSVFGALIQANGAATTNVGIKCEASGATNNYALLADGRVGIGTATPTVALECAMAGIGEVQAIFKNPSSSAGQNAYIAVATSSTNGSSYLELRDESATEANWVYVKRPLSTADLAFETAGHNTRMTIKADGKVGIGTASPNVAFEVVAAGAGGSGAFRMSCNDGSGTPEGLLIKYLSVSPDNTGWFFYCQDSSGGRMLVQNDGDVLNHDNTFGQLSDERIKTGIKDANSQWDDVKAIRVRNFTRRDDVAQYGDKAWEQIGVVAQEVELISPHLVKESPPGKFELEHCGFGEQNEDDEWVPKKDENGKDMTVKSMKYSILQIKAFKALQEAMAKIETLETKVTALENA